MVNVIPSASQQLKFLKNIQLILQSGSFSSTYKFALIISLSRLAIEIGEDSGAPLVIKYPDLAEKELLSNLVYGIQAAFSVDCSSSCLPSLKMTLLTTKVNKLNP